METDNNKNHNTIHNTQVGHVLYILIPGDCGAIDQFLYILVTGDCGAIGQLILLITAMKSHSTLHKSQVCCYVFLTLLLYNHTIDAC